MTRHTPDTPETVLHANAPQHDSHSVTPQKRVRRMGQRLTLTERKAAQDLFLAAFSKNANLTAAARRAGVDRRTVYQWQEHDVRFSLHYQQAELDANDMLRAAIFQRGVQGVKRPLHTNGRLVIDQTTGEPVMITEYSDTLLIFLAKARMPEFRDRQQLELTGKDGGPVEVTDARDILAARLAALAERRRPETDAE